MSNDRGQLISRRDFVASAVAAAAATTAASRAAADELPKLQEDDPTAVALKYVHDASTVDANLRSEERFCYNCALYVGSPDDEWAACSIFPGKQVAGKGWCSVWAAKQ